MLKTSMLEKGKISPRQAGELLFMTMIATAILFVPGITVGIARQDAWLSLLGGAILGLLTLGLSTWLAHKHRGKTLFQFLEVILGKWPGKLVSLMYVYLFMRISAITVREFGDFMSTVFMPQTPLSVFNISILLLAAWGVLAGLEVMARANEFIILLFVSVLLFILVLSTGNWEPSHVLPMFAEGIMPLVRTLPIAEVWKGETVAFAVIMPFITRPKRVFVSGAVATMAAGTLLSVGIFGTLAIFGPELLVTFRFPIFAFVRTINIGDFLTRFEPLVMVIWIAGAFIKAAFFYYCSSLGVAQILGLSQYRPVVYPVGIIIVVLSFAYFQNVAELVDFMGRPNPNIIILSGVMLLLLVLITIIREKVFGTDFGDTKDNHESREG